MVYGSLMADLYEPTKPVKMAPVFGARKGEGPMEDDELHGIVSGLIDHSIQYIEDELSPLRAQSTDYYFGRPLGNEQKGRSQFVVRTVQEVALAQLADLLRAVFGAERVVEYKPQGPEDAPAAEQATEFVIQGLESEGFFLKCLAVMKDGLVRKTGALKWGWDSSKTKCAYKLEGVTQEQLVLLGQEPGVEITKVTPEPTYPATDPNQPPPPATNTVELTRQYEDGCFRVWALPPEELIFDRDARSSDEFTLIGHRTMKSHGDLIAMGVEKAVVEEHGGPDGQLQDNEESVARRVNENTHEEPEAGEANHKTRYCETWVRVDYDGDGIAELRRICTIGPSNHVVTNDPAEDVQIAIFCPDPEPHTIVGQSTADQTMDIQRLQTSVVRGILDSAAQATFNRTWYREGYANAADVLNTAIGAPIRVKSGANDVGVFAHSFLGKDLFPLVELGNDMTERRTGHNKGVQGLDASALQSSTAAAVGAAITASQARSEMMVRIFAESLLKPLFKGLLKLLVQHQPRRKVMRLRGQWVEVDPRVWDAGMDVGINVSFGAGLVQEKIETLLEIKATQESLLQLLGPQNPIVNLKQYSDTLATITELRGFKDSARFFKRVTEEDLQKMAEAQAQSQQSPPPDPAIMVAQAQIQLEQQKAQMEMQIQQQKMELERQKAQWEDDRARDKQAAEIQLKLREMALEHNLNMSELDITSAIERERMTSQAGPNETTPRKKTVKITRHPATGKMIGAEITEEHHEERQQNG